MSADGLTSSFLYALYVGFSMAMQMIDEKNIHVMMAGPMYRQVHCQ